MRVQELLAESRQKGLKYTEKQVKGALDKVILELADRDSAAMTRLMNRYKRLDAVMKSAIEKRDEANAGIKEVADNLFNAEDAIVTRVIETVSYTVTLTRASKGEAKNNVDYEGAFKALAELVPELTEKVKELEAKYTTIVPGKDTPSALRMKSKVEEGIVGTAVAAIKNFVKSMITWGKSYDDKLNAIRRKYSKKTVTESQDDGYTVPVQESKWAADVHKKWAPPAGFFTKSATAIATGLKKDSKDLKQAMARLNFYINRGGKNLSAEDKDRLESAKKKLHKLFEDIEDGDGWYVVTRSDGVYIREGVAATSFKAGDDVYVSGEDVHGHKGPKEHGVVVKMVDDKTVQVRMNDVWNKAQTSPRMCTISVKHVRKT